MNCVRKIDYNIHGCRISTLGLLFTHLYNMNE